MPVKIEEVKRYTLHERITPGGLVVNVSDMKGGDIGVIEDSIGSPWTGAIVMRQYDWLIALNRVDTTWAIDHRNPNFSIRLLKQTDAITFVMK